MRARECIERATHATRKRREERADALRGAWEWAMRAERAEWEAVS